MISYGFTIPVSPSLGLHGPAFAHRSGISGARRSRKLVEYSGGRRLARRLFVVKEWRT
jgi:hypothetical protein